MVNFRTLDLNLLRLFDTLMVEGSLTRAAEVLAITQPAASHALKRLHAWVGEPLFVRNASGMVPTPRATALWPQVHAALDTLRRSLAPEGFDPRTMRVEFRVAMADALATSLAPSIVRSIEDVQGQPDVRILPLTSRDPRPLLHDDQADLAIGHFPGLLAIILNEGERTLLQHRQLHRTPYVCVMRRGHPLADGELTLDRYCAAHHVLVSVSGRAYAEVDEALARLGRRRRVLLTVNQYQTAAQVIRQSDLVTVLPETYVGTTGPTQDVVARPLPVDIPALTVEMVWLARKEAEPAHRWLRRAVLRAAGVEDTVADSQHGSET